MKSNLGFKKLQQELIARFETGTEYDNEKVKCT